MPSRLEELLFEQGREVLIRRLPLGLFLLDTLGRVAFVNPRMLEILGSPGQDATLGLNVLDLPPIRQAGVDAVIRQVLRRGEPQTGTARYTSIWGKTSILEYQFLPMRESQAKGQPVGPVVGVLAILQDVTELVEVREQLSAARQEIERLQGEVTRLGSWTTF